MTIEWNLRMLAAQKGLWTGAAVNRRLRERLGITLSPQTICNLMSKQPQRLSMNLVLAFCAALDCTPNDLLKVDTAITPTAARDLAEEIARANQPKAPRRRNAGRRKRVALPPSTRI